MQKIDFINETIGKKIRFYVGKFIEAVFIALFVTFVVSLLLGCKPIYINGYSMSNSIPYGTIMYIKKVDKSDLKVGDAITFRLTESGMPTTHRIYEIVGEEYITCGDYDGATPDSSPVKYNQIWGKYWFTFPYLGEVFRYIMTGIGAVNLILFSVGAFAVVNYFRTSLFFYDPNYCE